MEVYQLTNLIPLDQQHSYVDAIGPLIPNLSQNALQLQDGMLLEHYFKKDPIGQHMHIIYFTSLVSRKVNHVSRKADTQSIFQFQEADEPLPIDLRPLGSCYSLETLNNFLIKNIVKNIVKYRENFFFPFVLFNVFKMFLQCFCS
jgi:hypothetical protein